MSAGGSPPLTLPSGEPAEPAARAGRSALLPAVQRAPRVGRTPAWRSVTYGPVSVISAKTAHAAWRSSDGVPARGLLRGIAVAVTLASALVFYALVTHGTLNPAYDQPQGGFASDFLLAQARALVHGHLYVLPAQIPGECWVYHNRCYGYFGLTASLLRVPLLPMVGDNGLTPVYMTAALTLALGSALAICFRALANVPRNSVVAVLGVALAVSLGPASVLVAIARPAMYEETIAWAVGFGLFGVYCFLRWWSDRSRGWAALLVVSLTLGANARPTIIALAVVLAAGIVVDAVLERRGVRQMWPAVLLAAAVALGPAVTCLGVYWLKFHALVPSFLLDEQVSGPNASPYRLALRHVDHNKLTGLQFVPTNLLGYLRPDSLTFDSGFPFVNYRFGPGLRFPTLIGIPPGSILPERVSGLPDDMPLACVVIIAGLAYAILAAPRRRLALRASAVTVARSPMAYCIAGTAASPFVTLMLCGISNRYLADFYPLIVVAVSAAAPLLFRSAARLSGRSAYVLVGGVTLAIAWSLLVNLGLEYQDWWHAAV